MTEWDIEYQKDICYEEGARDRAMSDARNLLKKGIDAETVAECVELSLDEVRTLLSDNLLEVK